MPKLKMEISYDTETFKVEVECKGITLGLGNMMLREALIQLDEQRRIALMQKLGQQVQEEAFRRAIASGAKTREV